MDGLAFTIVRIIIGVVIGALAGAIAGYFYIYNKLIKRNIAGDELTPQKTYKTGEKIFIIGGGLFFVGMGVFMIIMAFTSTSMSLEGIKPKMVFTVFGLFSALLGSICAYSGITGMKSN